MNNEPVAWMELYKGEFNNIYKNWFDCKDKGEWSAIPLYTHPVKELTDEEIKQVWSGVKWNGSDPIELTFARAILRKAQEK